MDQGTSVVLGMLVAYAFGFIGLVFAWIGYTRRRREAAGRKEAPRG
jgi:hypothetical protein